MPQHGAMAAAAAVAAAASVAAAVAAATAAAVAAATAAAATATPRLLKGPLCENLRYLLWAVAVEQFCNVSNLDTHWAPS